MHYVITPLNNPCHGLDEVPRMPGLETYSPEPQCWGHAGLVRAVSTDEGIDVLVLGVGFVPLCSLLSPSHMSIAFCYVRHSTKGTTSDHALERSPNTACSL